MKITKKSKKLKHKTAPKGLVGVLMLAFGLLSFMSLFNTKMGLVGNFFYKFFTVLAGSGNVLLPVSIMLLGVLYLIPKYNQDLIKYAALFAGMILCVLVYLDGTKSVDLTLVDRIRLSVEYLDIATSGGVIGSIVGFFMYKLFGSLGTYFIVGLIFFICLFLLFSINMDSLKNFTYSVKDRSRDFGVRLREKKTQIQVKREAVKAQKSLDRETEKVKVKPVKNVLIRDYSEDQPDLSDMDTTASVEKCDIDMRPKHLFEADNGDADEGVVAHFSSPRDALSGTDHVESEDTAAIANSIRNNYPNTEETAQASAINPTVQRAFEQTYKKTVYKKPPLELLERSEVTEGDSNDIVRSKARIIEETMHTFNIDCRIVAINKGPVVTLYELQPGPGVKLSKIVALTDNLTMALAASDIRIEAPIPGKAAVGIEVPNKNKDSVSIRDILSSNEFKKIPSDVPLALGKDISGHTIISSIEKMPHLLIAGATGSGKSVCINTIITSILYKSSPDDVKLMLIDPKIVELSVYNRVPHLLIPVVTDPKKAAFALSWAVTEMERRYGLFAEMGVRDLKSYNNKMKGEGELAVPKIVIVVDEFADLMMVAQKEVEDYVTRLAQKARAAGIYLILATQRPSVDVITGTIKANIPSRIAFAVSSQIDSRTILDMAGAEKLLGKGDMLFYPSFYSKPLRVQGAFISDDEVERVVDFIAANSTYNEALKEKIVQEIQDKKEVVSDRDDLFADAIKYILTDDQASISFLQRKLKVGYSRAARIVDQLEESGIIGPHEGSKPRKLLMSKEEIETMIGEKIE
ncbi:DNA translocase FtsK [Peptoniphilus equinus]|uniref:DNA translocase FtsK n=1 Tax=Peptoniphilus equinus TaxID=3016343 RepID=A0ABY7QWD4_9FIRM|nr:DNA translocase FtsK [Peptoniphilus equinus]WBW50686.1 DNA translocase FtsK [Peptoniphilus equinus]